MRSIYLICYDICDAKRLRSVYKTMKGAGDSIQYSVFRCELSDMELLQLKTKLWDLLNLKEDRVMVVRLGPVNSRRGDGIEFWGRPRVEHSANTAVIV